MLELPGGERGRGRDRSLRPGDRSRTPYPNPLKGRGAAIRESFGHIFRIDSLRARDAQAGLQPRGEMADLLDLLTRQMAGAAANRIRRANFLELVADTLDSCRGWLDEAMPSVRETLAAITSSGVSGPADCRRNAGRTAGQPAAVGEPPAGPGRLAWGLSPFSLVLRVYQGLGGLLAGAMLYRARTPAQLALWGGLEGTHTWRRWRRNRATTRPRSRRRRRLGPRRIAQGRRHHRRVRDGSRTVGQASLPVGQATMPTHVLPIRWRPSPKRRRRALSPASRPTWNRWWPGSPAATPAGSPAGATKSSWPRCSGCCCTGWRRTSSTTPGWRTARAGSRHRLLPLGRLLAGVVVPGVAVGVLQPAAARAARRDRPTRRRLARRLVGRGPVRRRRNRLPPRRAVPPGTRCPLARGGNAAAAIGRQRCRIRLLRCVGAHIRDV